MPGDSQVILICSYFLEVIPRVAVIAIWTSCLARALSESNLRRLLSVKLIMLRLSECLDALNPEGSADFM